ncbi:MAG: hypothetical protein RXO36_05390, partial [Candidatus Nanopusillus acidilobi]
MKNRKFIGILLAFLMFASIFAIVSFTGNTMGSGENTVIATIKVGKYAIGMDYDPQNGYIYVTNEYSNNITVINGATNSIINNITLPSNSHPQGIAYDSQNGYLYVADDNNPRLIVINPSTNSISTIDLPSGFSSYYILYDPDNGYLYISGRTSSTGEIVVFAPSTNQTVTNITAGSNPWGMAYDHDNKCLYVGDDGNANIYVIDTQSNTLIKTFNVNAPGNDFAVYDPYNKYVYVSNCNNNMVYAIDTTSNTFAGKNITSGLNSPEGIVFHPMKYLYIANWNNITVIDPSTNTQVASISTLSGGNGFYLLYDPANNYIYETEPFGSSQTFSSIEVIKTFDIKYTVAFTETGLPTGTLWYVNLSNGQSFSSTTNTITFSEPNGTYSYTIATANKSYAPSSSSGSFTVNEADVNIAITFTLVTYPVAFTETGLPTGTLWYVNLSNGQSFSSTTNTITFPEPNGTYSYTIATVNKSYSPNPSSGSFTVNNTNVNINITFNKIITGPAFPSANITAPSVVALDTVIILSGKNSTASAGATIINFTWNIYEPNNNHYIKYGETISIYFNVAGAYTINLTVKDSANKTNSTSIKINVISPSVDSNIQISYTLTVLSNGYYEYDVIVNAKDNVSIVQFLASVDGIYANATLTKQMGYQYYYVVKFNPDAFGYGNHTIKFQAINSLNEYNTAITYATFGSLSQGGIIAYITGHIALTIVIIIFIIILLAFIYELYRNRAIKKLMKKKI